MSVPFLIAKRYLFSKRKKNFINYISILSMLGVAFITAALVIVLSVFNGLEDLLHSLNNSFDSEIKIEAKEGKSFEVTDKFLQQLQSVKGVQYVTEVIEDYAYARYRDANQIVTLKGVSENFIEQKRIPKESVIDGELKLRDGDVMYAVVGSGVQYTLSIATGDNMFPLQMYYIKNVKSTLDPSQMYSKLNIIPGGVFSIVQQFDENYIVVPLEFAKELLNYGNKRTAIEIKTSLGQDIFKVEKEIESMLGSEYNVLNHEEQHQDLYRLLKMEKLFTFLAFTILLGIGSINIFFTLMMLALDKKKDISVLASLGANNILIRNIFLLEGGLIALIGTTLGLTLGAAFCYLQQEFGLVSMGMASAVMQGYPVQMQLADFLSTLLVVVVITFVISIRPAIQASKIASLRYL